MEISNIVTTLLNAGIKSNVIDNIGQTALFNAVLLENSLITELILLDEVDPQFTQINLSNNDDKTVLKIAVELENERIVRLLIDQTDDINTININQIDNKGQTVLFTAVGV